MRAVSFSYKILIAIIIISNVLSIFTIKDYNKNEIILNENHRNLQFSSKSVYYKIPIQKNNVTGTGDIMNDVPYKALCSILNCSSGCCIGEINLISCGDKATCDSFYNYKNIPVIVPAVIVPIFVLFFLIFLILLFSKKYGFSYLISLILAILSILIITIPCVLYYVKKNGTNFDSKVKHRKQNIEDQKEKSSADKKQIYEREKEKNDLLTINKVDNNKKPSSKFNSNKTIEALNEYKKIINEIDENQEKEEEDLKMNNENRLISNKNESMNSEGAEMDSHYVTDPLKKVNSSNRLSENNLIDMEEMNQNEENKDQNNDENKDEINQEDNVEMKNEEGVEKELAEENIINSPQEEPQVQEEAVEPVNENLEENNENERVSEIFQRMKQLPLLKTPEEAAKRCKIFDMFDVNGNLYLSLSEIENGVRNILSYHEKFLKKEVIKRAFQSAKKSGAKRSKISDDYVEKNEFRTFLVFLRQYSEYYEMFDLIDTEDDKKISFEEFEAAVPIMKRWGIDIEDTRQAFDSIDSNDGGSILFDEFCYWAINKNLSLENDEDFDDEELAKLALLNEE